MIPRLRTLILGSLRPASALEQLNTIFLAVFTAAGHTVWRRGPSAQVRLCRRLPINYPFDR
jgi:hypothetical protein